MDIYQKITKWRGMGENREVQNIVMLKYRKGTMLFSDFLFLKYTAYAAIKRPTLYLRFRLFR